MILLGTAKLDTTVYGESIEDILEQEILSIRPHRCIRVRFYDLSNVRVV